MNNCIAMIAGICFTFGTAMAEPSPTEQKLDKAIVLMSKAVEEAKKGNFVLGDPFSACPGYEPQIIPDGVEVCSIEAYSCRCF